MIYTTSGEKEISFLFLHVPRTGGKHINQILNNSGYFVPHEIYFSSNSLCEGKEIKHLTYDEQCKTHPLSCEDTKKFTIFRDPVDKFVSAFPKIIHYFEMTNKNIEELVSYDSFCFYLDKFRNGFSNWFTFQSEYYREDVKVWKYENGFGDLFFEWLSDEVGIKSVEPFYDQEYQQDKRKLKMFERIEDNIKKYYEKDILLYNSL